MPVSDYRQISEVLHLIALLKPRRILDVGVGFGKWGTLCREVLDVADGSLDPALWTTRIEGIEVFEGYRNALWEFAYDEVHIGDAFSVIDRLEQYNVILACDVIEHFDKPRGQQFIDKMLGHGDIVIITSPRGFVEQGPEFDNEHEVHRSGWSKSDFKTRPHLVKHNAGALVAVLASSDAQLESLRFRRSPLDQLGVRWATIELAHMLWNRLRERVRRTTNSLPPSRD